MASAECHSDWPESLKLERSIERLDRIEGFAYRGCGQVVDQATGLVEVLGFVLELDELPCTGFVEFECARLSIMMLDCGNARPRPRADMRAVLPPRSGGEPPWDVATSDDLQVGAYATASSCGFFAPVFSLSK